MANLFEGLGIRPCDILLPRGVDMRRWAVVACDQFTAQRDYWDAVEEYVGNAPSALHMIVPEIDLDTDKGRAQEARAARMMADYCGQGLFTAVENSFIYVRRQTPHAPLRQGLVVALDLEAYDYAPGSRSLTRATEGTIIERLPPRMAVRRRACLELPHIMVLIDDPDATVIEPLAHMADEDALYDFDLMMASGHISGYRVQGDEPFARVAGALRALKQDGRMLYAMGDGNHSLAAARACWEELKPTLSPLEREDHPARWALVELVNLHDDGLVFHPIHRVIYGVDDQFLPRLMQAMHARPGTGSGHSFTCIQNGLETALTVDAPTNPIDVGTLQDALDAVIAAMPGATVDYVHGADVVRQVAGKPGNAGVLLGAMDKSALFPAVEKLGALPRKTFSMGEACEKRFYLESRRIVR